ncbi:hypothetical protein PVAP13_5KG179307 [Panicum virgatum]|uniref:Uncharacterized protein n=2 Tax=Panicum virgatum TaxID=38727 RepID=A0A8T0SJH5_PANVG|nr:hypothetical protein PVAP13_5KG179307 [Panicum virgatum]
MYADFGKEPPAELLSRLENIDARRQQVVGSSHGGSHSVDRRDEATMMTLTMKALPMTTTTTTSMMMPPLKEMMKPIPT